MYATDIPNFSANCFLVILQLSLSFLTILLIESPSYQFNPFGILSINDNFLNINTFYKLLNIFFLKGFKLIFFLTIMRIRHFGYERGLFK